MNVVVRVLLHQIDVGLQPIHFGDLRPAVIPQPCFVLAIRLVDLHNEIVNQHRRSREFFPALQRDRRGYIAAASAPSASSAAATSGKTATATTAPAADASSENRGLHVTR